MNDRQAITVALGERSYPIVIGSGILDDMGRTIASTVRGRRIGLVSDESVWEIYGQAVERSLTHAGYSLTRAVVPSGEQHKTLASVSHILDTFLEARFDRQSTLVALGGGVVGDMAGFAAAILLRGVSFVQIPTTVVAQVDASVGGKTGVDHPLGKNLIGAFHQPSLVAIDVATLATLPERELHAGLAEVVKHAVIRDADLFAHLETALKGYRDRTANPDSWVGLITTNCRIKAAVVAMDERESGLREVLNYGHTAGHAIEALGMYDRYRHGEAVLFGMKIAGALAHRRGMWSARDRQRQDALISALTTQEPPADLSVEAVWDRMGSDKKVRAGVIRFVLPTRLGDVVVVDDVSREEFDAAWKVAIVSDAPDAP